MVAGDGDHSAHCLYPSGEANEFEYTDTIFDKAGGTVGALAFSDLDGDGWQEIWLPNYDNSYVELWKITPAQTMTEKLI